MTIMELRKQLRDKDMKLTDIRLEALSSAHQLEQLREAMNKMKVSKLMKEYRMIFTIYRFNISKYLAISLNLRGCFVLSWLIASC